MFSLKIDKSPGPDGIHPLFLNRTASVLAKLVAALFTRSYQEGTEQHGNHREVVSMAGKFSV